MCITRFPEDWLRKSQINYQNFLSQKMNNNSFAVYGTWKRFLQTFIEHAWTLQIVDLGTT